MTLLLRSSLCSLFLHATAVLAVFLCCRTLVVSPASPGIQPSDYLFINVVNFAPGTLEAKTVSSSPNTKDHELPVKVPVSAPNIAGTQPGQKIEATPKLSPHKIVAKKKIEQEIDRKQEKVRKEKQISIADKINKVESLSASDKSREATEEPVAGGAAPAVQTDKNGLTTQKKETAGSIVGVGGTAGRDVAYLRMNYEYIRRIVTRNLDFPASARRRRLSGRIEVSFLVGNDGRVNDIHLDSSSGHALLDMNVVQAIRRSAPFPAPPEKARITLPIVFRLQ